MKKRMLCALCCLMACFAMSGCFDSDKFKEPNGIMKPTQALFDGLNALKQQEDSSSEAAKEAAYYVVIDDGSGMKGFVSSYCTTYGAMLTTVMDVTVGGNLDFIRASDLVSGKTDQGEETADFLRDAAQEGFFRDKPNDLSNVIDAMAARYQPDSGQVMILITDLMIPTAEECMRSASAIQLKFLLPEHSTVGVIGVLGDFNGDIENLPINTNTGRPRTIKDYMVLEKDVNGVFQHPLYILMMGDDRAVLAGMEKALTKLKNCGQLDDTNPYYALFLNEYGVARNENDDPPLRFHMGHKYYNAANYDVRYLVRGIADNAGEIKYPSTAPIPEEYQQILKQTHIVNLYAGERGNKENNVEIRCTIPYRLTDSTQRGEMILDKHGLIVPAKDISISEDNSFISVDLSILEYSEDKSGKTSAAWVEPDQSLIRCESATFDDKSGKIEVMLSVDNDMLALDEPMLCIVSVSVCTSPRWEDIEALYDTAWISQLTLSPKEFELEFRLKSDSSARFTAASTARTPYLFSLLGGICDRQIEITCNTIRQASDACAHTDLFGVIVRDYPAKYDNSRSWGDTEDFGGWAISQKKAGELKSEINDGN